jgi:pimeloyl-ACP methyl ester carboxylesterase
MPRIFALLLLCVALSSCSRGSAATVDGAEIHWESSGNGPALVFIHGVERDTTDWEYQVAEFEDAYRVITLDLPGHGQSGSLSEVKDSSFFWGGSLIPLAEAIEVVRAEAGIDRMVLIGHSLGGWVIGEYMMHYPQYVAGVVAADTDFHGNIRLTYERTIIREDSIEAPMLLVLADNGVFVSTFGAQPLELQQRFLERYPGSRVETMSNVGHDLQLEDPAEFNRLLGEFLEEIDF